MNNEIKTPISSVKLPAPKPFVFQRMAPGPPKYLTVLVYGPPGSGKTWFAGTFPNTLFIDCQGGLLTVRKKNVAFIRPRSYVELLQATIAENVAEFETIALDTATEAARIVMDSTLTVSGVRIRELPQLQDWMQTIERVRQFFRKLLDLDEHVVVTCEEAIIKDEDTGRVIAGPSLPGKLTHEAGALFDCVFHLRNVFNQTTKTKQRVILTEPEGMYQQVKDRTGVLEKLEVPDFQVIWKKLQSA